MKRLATFLLLFCVALGLAAQRPAQAFAPPMEQTDMASMSHMDMSAMPGCVAAMAQDATHKPCKCGLAGCIAMMTSGASLMLADASMAPAIAVAGERQDHVARVATLRGRSTAPELPPPSILT